LGRDEQSCAMENAGVVVCPTVKTVGYSFTRILHRVSEERQRVERGGALEDRESITDTLSADPLWRQKSEDECQSMRRG
jgi:hypothetical protein